MKKQTLVNKFVAQVQAAFRRLKGKKGQTLVEYALILAFISVVAIAVLIKLGQNVNSVFSQINSQLQVAVASH